MIARRATFRVQLRQHGVDFSAAARALDGLARLGISHLYLSPVLEARRGSAHGYDGTDPRRVDPALGGAEGLRALADAAAARGMGLLIDVVPNHLAAHPENPFFADLLARGRASPFAAWFDVDWEGGGGRILLPWLPAPLERCIETGALRIEGRGARARLRCGELALPLARGTAPGRGEPAPAALRRVLARQHYALGDWRRARRRLNYRRFFDVSELIGVRAEQDGVFEPLHAELLALAREGRVAGLRVDHVDGIADPRAYLRRLRRALDGAAGPGAWLVVEKILERGEPLPRDWPADGTTGYEFLNQVEALFLDPDGVRRLERDWARRVGARGGFAAAARSGRRLALRELLEADVRRVARRVARLPAARRVARLPVGRRAEQAAVARALRAFLTHLGVYRVYPSERGALSAGERRRVAAALAGGGGEAGDLAPGLAALRRVLLPRRATRDRARTAAARAVQQLAAAAAAKGVEDTAFYTWTPLLSRNEVGGDPGCPLEGAVEAFHAANRDRQRRAPFGLLAASTHDTKRSADLRARLDVLGEIPDAWREAQERWLRWNAAAARALRGRARDLRSELLLYQTLVGIWPLRPRGRPPGLAARRRLAARLEAYLVKACREAERETSWLRPDARFESALTACVRALLLPADAARSRFLADLSRFARQLARPGLWNALARCALQLGSPGVPDLYQGDALWRFDLVDPDNRRPVDFPARARRLEGLDAAFDGPGRARLLQAWMASPEDGRVKLHVLRRGLAARAEAPSLFTTGAYRPLAARGARAHHVVAFARSEAGRWALVAAPRLVRALVADPEAAPVGPDVWNDTRLVLPRALAGRPLRSALTGEEVVPGRELPLAELFAALPVALLLSPSPAASAAEARGV